MDMGRHRGTAALQWFLIGLAAGAAVMLLFAPASGNEVRRVLRKKAEDAGDRINDTAGAILSSTRDLADDAGEAINRLFKQ
jgi:gas vesicle protein